MQNNNSDRFDGIPKDFVQKNNDNFFLMEEKPSFQLFERKPIESSRRLNDYDFNLLQEDAYKDVSDDLFKLEYKISKLETEILNLESQIQTAFDIHDDLLIDELINRKAVLEEEYESLIVMYNDKSLSAKISGSLSNIFGERIKSVMQNLKESMSYFSESILEKLPKKFSSVVELKRSLTKLENINKSVDELVNLNIPYGENINKYEQLSKYIIKANNIQNELAEYIKKK